MVLRENQVDLGYALELEVSEAPRPPVAVSRNGEVVEGGVLLEIVAEVLLEIRQMLVTPLRSVVRVGNPPTNRVKSFFLRFCESSTVGSVSEKSFWLCIRCSKGWEILYFNPISKLSL